MTGRQCSCRLTPLATLPVQGWGKGGCDLRRRPMPEVREVRGENLRAVFFAKGMMWCRTCISHYNRQHSASAPKQQPVEEKQCTTCHQLLPASRYSLHPLRPTGLQPRCRMCCNASKRDELAHNAAVPLPAAALATFKYCFSCQEHRPRAAFSWKKGAWDGLQPQCKACDGDRWRSTA